MLRGCMSVTAGSCVGPVDTRGAHWSCTMPICWEVVSGVPSRISTLIMCPSCVSKIWESWLPLDVTLQQ